MLAAPLFSLGAVSSGTVTWPIPWHILGFLVRGAPPSSHRVRVRIGVCSPLPLAGRHPFCCLPPSGFGPMVAHPAVPPPPPPSLFRPPPRVDMPAQAPPAFRKFKPIPVISVAPSQTSVSLPLPPAPLELKLTASATQSMHLAGVHSSESSASQTDQQYSALLVRWREFLSELGAASALYSEACASQP